MIYNCAITQNEILVFDFPVTFSRKQFLRGHSLPYVHHVNGLASRVVILKVNGLEIAEQAEIDLGVRVPLGFHCNWVDSNDLDI